jgi:nucleoside-diphosphate-sugar epimerase
VPRYLVTGGGGFIGSHIVSALLAQDMQVRVLENFFMGRRVNLAPYADRIELIEGDVRSYHVVQEAVTNVDYVLHQAALTSVPRSVRDPITTAEVNVLGTLNLLRAARDAGVKRLVFASSSSVYGDSPILPKTELMPCEPISPYAISKLTGEQYCRSFWRLYGLPTVCLRYFNVFGPRQDFASQYSAVIPRFIRALLRGDSLTVNGDGQQSRDFTYVANVVHANLLACQASDVAGKVFNVATGRRCTLLELIGLLSEMIGRTSQVIHAPSRAGDVPHSHADISSAWMLLDYRPIVILEEGLRKTVQWFQENLG